MFSYLQTIVDKQTKSIDESYIFLKYNLDIQDTYINFANSYSKVCILLNASWIFILKFYIIGIIQKELLSHKLQFFSHG